MSQHHYQWLLMIEGLEPLWYSHATPAGQPANIEPRTLSRGLQGVSVASAEALDLQVGIASGGTYTVTLALRDDNETADLLRIGPRGASANFTLLSSLTQAFVGPVVVGEAIPAGTPAAGVVHVGLEAIRYTGLVLGAPGQFTGVTRAYMDSRLASHTVQADYLGGGPRVALEPTTWMGRGARLFYADVPVGQVAGAGDWVEACRGYLREAPAPDADFLTVQLVLTPWVSALGRTVGGPTSETRLQHGVHAFDGVSAGQISAIRQVWGAGEVFDHPTTTATVAGPGFVINNWPWYRHKGVFNTADTSPNSARLRGPLEECRNLTTRLYLDPVPATAYLAPGGAGTDPAISSITLDAVLHPGGVPFTVTKGAHIRNAEVHQDIEFTFAFGAPAVLPWPSLAGSPNDLFNSALEPTTVLGLPLWAWHTVQRGAEGWELTGRLNGDAAPAGKLKIVLNVPKKNTLWYGLQFCEPDAVVPMQHDLLSEVEQKHSHWPTRTVEISTPLEMDISVRDRYPIRGYADAFFQSGEQWIYVEDDVFEGRTEFPIVISFVDADGVAKRLSTLVNSVVKAETVTAGAPGYLLGLPAYASRDLQSFGDWPGQDTAVIRLAARWSYPDTPVDILLDVLLSSEGRGYAGGTPGLAGYDRLPWGMSLGIDDVDVPSFRDFPVPPGATRYVGDYTILDETELGALLGSVLRLIGGALVMKLDQATGRQRVSLQRTGLPTLWDVVDTFLDSKWGVSPRPSVSFEQSTENVLEVRAAQDFQTGDSLVTVRLANVSLIKEYDGRTEVYSEDAPWLALVSGSPQENRASLLGVALERWALFGHPRLVIRGQVDPEQVGALHVGSVVRVFASNIRTYNGLRGLNGGICVLTELSQDRWDARADVGLVYWANYASGYAPACKVLAIAGPLALGVAANFYSDTTDPVTGAAQIDSGFFAAGDTVWIVPADVTARVSRVIQSILGGTITFTAAHGFAAVGNGLTIRPHTYDSNTSGLLEQHAYQGSPAGTLGAAADPAFQYT